MKICTGCKEQLPLDRFLFETRRNRHMARCKSCRTESTQKWRGSKPGYERDRYQSEKTRTRERHLMRKYGINLSDYQLMLDQQEGVCAICSAPEAEQFKGVSHVDHCHTTGKVRGLLCRGCNHMLGVVADDPHKLLRAITYLKGPQVAAEVIGAYMDCALATD